MPAPQVAVVQRHSAGVVGSAKLPFESAVVDATTHCAGLGLLPGELVGNARALDCSRAMIWPAVRFGLADIISAATPTTMGVAKLVPTLASFSALPTPLPVI
jgi:hypothetical protein